LVHVEPDRFLRQGSYGVVKGARYCGSRAAVKFQKNVVFPDAQAVRIPTLLLLPMRSYFLRLQSDQVLFRF